MSIQMKNGCLVYYGNLIGYQAKNQTEVTVDPQFRREELESWLARRGLVPRWEEGVYERLSNEGFRVSDSSPELQSCRIWQLKPGTPIQMRFIGLDAMAQKFGGPTPEQYHVVYDGRIQDNDPGKALEQIQPYSSWAGRSAAGYLRCSRTVQCIWQYLLLH